MACMILSEPQPPSWQGVCLFLGVYGVSSSSSAMGVWCVCKGKERGVVSRGREGGED